MIEKHFLKIDVFRRGDGVMQATVTHTTTGIQRKSDFKKQTQTAAIRHATERVEQAVAEQG